MRMRTMEGTISSSVAERRRAGGGRRQFRRRYRQLKSRERTLHGCREKKLDIGSCPKSASIKENYGNPFPDPTKRWPPALLFLQHRISVDRKVRPLLYSTTWLNIQRA